MRRLLYIFLMLGFMVSSLSAFSQNIALKPNTLAFDINAANKKLDVLNNQLLTENLKRKQLEDAIRELSYLQDKAEICVKQSEAQLKSVNALLKDSPVKKISADYTFLLHRKELQEKQFSECRLFIFRSQEVLATYKTTISGLNTSKIFHRSIPIWEVPQKIKLDSVKIDGEKILTLSGTLIFTLPIAISFFILLCLSIILGFFLRFLCTRFLKQKQEASLLSKSFVSSMRTYIIPITFMVVMSTFFYISTLNFIPRPSLELISYAFLIFFILLAILKFVFFLKPQFPLQKPLIYRSTAIITWGLIGYIVIILLRDQNISVHAIELARTIFITLSIITIVVFCWTFTQSSTTKKRKTLRIFMKTMLALLLAMILITEWVGFHLLAIHLISSIVLTIALIGVTYILVKIISTSLYNLDQKENKTSQFMHQILGVRSYRKISELSLLKFSLYSMLTLGFIIFFLWIWGVSRNVVDSVTTGLIKGFKIADFNIIPSQIIFAFIIFALISMAARLLATYVQRHRQFAGHKERQVAIASLITYIGFTLALIIALLVAGVNFTGLAIIAGALSVGVGFGLQNITTNFISGLILLLEKLIKPGDRIMVDDIEGFVTKIRVRSTQIKTLNKEDIIVPNSDLISKKVMSCVFQDFSWRISIQIAITQNSDTELTRKILLKVASEHSDVIQKGDLAPQVFFRTFNDSSLLFELMVVIYDVAKKLLVTSDLNFAIARDFRANGIHLAVVQREIYIQNERNEQKGDVS